MTPSANALTIRTLVVGPFAENTYLVGDREAGEALIVDPGAEADRILEEVKALGLQVKTIVNTHGHIDHIGAVAAVKEATGASYAIHPRDLPLIQNPSPLHEMIPDFRQPPGPDLHLKGGDTVTVGQFRFLVLETPGHSPGGISLYGHDMVFTGDTLFQGSIGRFDLPGGDYAQLISSILSKLLILPNSTVVLPGHGPQTTIGQEKQHNPFLASSSLLRFPF